LKTGEKMLDDFDGTGYIDDEDEIATHEMTFVEQIVMLGLMGTAMILMFLLVILILQMS
jgi:hypothetical protein